MSGLSSLGGAPPLGSKPKVAAAAFDFNLDSDDDNNLGDMKPSSNSGASASASAGVGGIKMGKIGDKRKKRDKPPKMGEGDTSISVDMPPPLSSNGAFNSGGLKAPGAANTTMASDALDDFLPFGERPKTADEM